MTYTWIPFHKELAEIIAGYRAKPDELNEIVTKCIRTVKDGVSFPDGMDPITPFSFPTLFGPPKRAEIYRAYKDAFHMDSDVPTDFFGVPVMSVAAQFYHKTAPDTVPVLWEFLDCILDKSDEGSEARFIDIFDRLLEFKGIRGPKLSMALFWIDPDSYLTVDKTMRSYLKKRFSYTYPDENHIDGQAYLKIVKDVKRLLENTDIGSFVELSDKAWVDSNGPSKPVQPIEEHEHQTWLMSLGTDNKLWPRSRDTGTIAIGWDELGDLNQYREKSKIPSNLGHNDALAVHEFVHEMKQGDEVYIKNGRHMVIAHGKVVSDYEYRPDLESYRNVRKVEWLHILETGAKVSQLLPMKTLTNITGKPYCQMFMDALTNNEGHVDPIVREQYNVDSFLEEVGIDRDRYDTIVSCLEDKMCIILQGPPGVGKTFMAKRLAFSIMGEKDESRVQTVQFHQSYGYEEFMIGLRPKKEGEGFELKDGAFVEFCDKARRDPEKEYYLIIDEINRGNISRIFGEVMMLIEASHRDEEICLMYGGRMFSVPGNVYIIGTMNTADRSLAIMDYALRRRFAFIDVAPRFELVKSPEMRDLIPAIEKINNAISKEASLGDGFLIGHSYLMTERPPSSVIETELKPLLKEYWFDNPNEAEIWIKELDACLR